LGKKRLRKKTTSQGQRKNVANKHKFDLWGPLDRALFKAKARAKGKRVCETIPNPDKSNTKARFIRVCTNG
jgi:5-formyltetrahydrofolate cyclo-ligase